jgi:hypothetical protein
MYIFCLMRETAISYVIICLNIWILFALTSVFVSKERHKEIKLEFQIAFGFPLLQCAAPGRPPIVLRIRPDHVIGRTDRFS